MARRHTASWERGRCPRADLQSAPGRLGYQPPGMMTGVGGASLDWDRRRRVTPVQTASQEAWPEAEPLGWNTPLGKSRGGTPASVRAPKGRAPHRKMRRLVTLRLPAFRFLHFLGLMGRNRNNGRPKGRPHPCPFPGPDRFRARRDDIFASARSVRASRARQNAAAKTRRETGESGRDRGRTKEQPTHAGRGRSERLTRNQKTCRTRRPRRAASGSCSPDGRGRRSRSPRRRTASLPAAC
jgi:hypothetical protein